MTVLLDTSVIINVLRDREGRVSDIQNILRGGHVLCVSAMTIGEIYAGIRPEEERKVEMFLIEMECYDVTERLARYAGLLRNQWRRRGRTLELADMMIAATALGAWTCAYDGQPERLSDGRIAVLPRMSFSTL